MNLPTYISGNIQTRAYAILREEVYTVLEKQDITPSVWSMLGIVFEAKDGIRQSEVARALNVKPPLITIMARTLQEQLLIESVTNQFDARAKLLRVTPYGKKFIKLVESELYEHLETLLSGLTESEMITYQKVLETIIANKNRSLKNH
jgi:MarR family transcriptional regulator, organic hydroperoxide resistance regulator